MLALPLLALAPSSNLSHNNTKFVIEPEQVFETHAFMSASAMSGCRHCYYVGLHCSAGAP